MKKTVRVLLFEPDLIFSSKIEGMVRRLGASLTAVSDIDALASELSGGTPRLLILNLDILEGKLALLKQMLSGKDCVSVGYFSHMNRQLGEEARGSGVGVVVSRGEFMSRIQSILAQALRE